MHTAAGLQPNTLPAAANCCLLPPHLCCTLQLGIQLLHCGLQLAHALTTTHQQYRRLVLQQPLAVQHKYTCTRSRARSAASQC